VKSKVLLSLLAVTLVMAFGAAGTAAAGAAAVRGLEGVVGDVKSISGATFILATPQRGDVMVHTTALTRFRAKDNPNFSLANLKVGDRVAVQGRWAAAKLQARVVALIPAELRDKALGQVQSITGSTIALFKLDGSTVQVLTTSTTRFRAKGIENPTLADIKPGDIVAALGQQSGNALTAAQVVFHTPKTNVGPRAVGKISAINGGTLMLDLPFGQKLTVTTDANTFVVQRSPDRLQIISVADLQVGDGVTVLGVRSSDGKMIAAKAILAGDGEGLGGPGGPRLPAIFFPGAPQGN
jgi:hypothetical protein